MIRDTITDLELERQRDGLVGCRTAVYIPCTVYQYCAMRWGGGKV